MKKTVLTLQEFYQLDAEINGVINTQTNEKLIEGLLQEKISLPTKYWLHDLSKKINVEKEVINGMRDEMIKKYGTPDDQGNIQIPMYANQTINEYTKEAVAEEINPTYIKFTEEFNSLLEEKRELEHHEFKIEDFSNVVTQNNYFVFYKLIDAYIAE